MIAYHGKHEVKAFYLHRVRQHRLADQLIHGRYWEDGKGCAVGCTIHSSNHAAYEEELGIPRVLGRLEGGIFEGLPAPDDMLWPEQFLAVIPVGADLGMVWPQFALRLLSDRQYGVLCSVQDQRHTQQKSAIDKVVTSYQAWIDTGRASAATRTAAAAAAACAAATAACATTAAAYAVFAAAAAACATTAAAYAAAYAVFAAAAAYATGAATGAAASRRAWQWQAQMLLGLLRDAPVLT